VRLEGSIDAFSLPDIFSLLSMTKKSGGLHLRRDGAHGVVWFTTGALTGGAADVSTQSLARRLIGAGLVDDDALTAAVAHATADDVGVGRALQVQGTIDDGVLHDVSSEHIVDTVFDLLRWPDGDFAFVIDEPNPDDVGVSRQVDDVVTEARNRLEAWSEVSTTVSSPQTVLSQAANPPVELQLSRDDWTLLALVDGRRTVADIVRLLGRGEYAVVSCLADLMTRGLLVVADIDMAGDLARRLSLLSSAETAEPGAAEVDVVPDPDLEPEVAPEPPVVAVPAQPTHTDVDGQDGGLISDIDAPAEVAPSKPLSRVASSEDRDVTPLRSEAVLPPRQVDFPEPPMARPLAAAVGATPAAALAASIERDPSVNKSLLLRLIAGVRGL
jgi:hypothetical protein